MRSGVLHSEFAPTALVFLRALRVCLPPAGGSTRHGLHHPHCHLHTPLLTPPTPPSPRRSPKGALSYASLAVQPTFSTHRPAIIHVPQVCAACLVRLPGPKLAKPALSAKSHRHAMWPTAPHSISRINCNEHRTLHACENMSVAAAIAASSLYARPIRTKASSCARCGVASMHTAAF